MFNAINLCSIVTHYIKQNRRNDSLTVFSESFIWTTKWCKTMTRYDDGWWELTDVRHFRDSGHVRVLGESRLVVVDVVDLDDELGLTLQRLVGEAVDGFGVEDVVGLLLPVQPLGGVDVPWLLVYPEEGSRSLPCEDVPHASISSIRIWVKLWREDEKTWWCGSLHRQNNNFKQQFVAFPF